MAEQRGIIAEEHQVKSEKGPGKKKRNNTRTSRVKSKKGSTSTAAEKAVSDLESEKTSMPMDVMPMLATLASEPMDEPGWLYEIKWDGFRSISYLLNSDVDIRSRNNKKFNEKFYPIRQALEDWDVRAVVDGEIT